MRFLLNDSIVKEIVFAMENQDDDIIIDVKEGRVFSIGDDQNCVDEDEVFDEERYIPIPSWDSSDGYALMDEFVASTRNPLVRAELHSALLKGRGVFKAFKTVLSSYPEIERKWFSFKESELKRRVYRWYDDLRESWGLEKINFEQEEVENLLALDFQIRTYEKSDRSKIESLLETSSKAYFLNAQPFIAKYFLNQLVETSPDFDEEDSLIIVAQTTDDDLVAFLWAFRINDQNEKGMVIRWIGIEADYLDSGFEAELLAYLLKEYRHDCDFFILDMPGLDDVHLDSICGIGWNGIGSIRYLKNE